MNTVQDLVDKLNETNEDESIFSLSEIDKERFSVNREINGESWSIAIFDTFDKRILMTTNINIMDWQVMYWVSKYALEHTYEDWFPENKYNIVIGKDTKHPIYSAYRKCGNSEYAVDSNVFKEELKDEKYVFTEEEVNDLQKQLTDTFSALVDIAMKEV